MKKIVISLGIILSVAAVVAVTGTFAFLSDTETSANNTFIAGAIDLTIDNTCHFDGMVCSLNQADAYVWQEEAPGSSTYPELIGQPCTCTWTADQWKDGTALFSFADIKPGDQGENTISLHVDSNPAWICAEISDVKQYDNDCNEPELKAENALYNPNPATCGNPGEGEGELWQNLTFNFWMDNGVGDGHKCNNIKDGDEDYIQQGINATDLKYAIADAQSGGGPITDSCVGVEWSVPIGMNNIAQTDSVTGNITFKAYQARHQENFLCNPPVLTCGDGIINQTSEQCDAGTQNGVACTPAYNSSCTYCSTECTEVVLRGGVCGDGQTQNGEQCDDGNAVNDDGCTNTCKLAVCGDGILQTAAGEICDDGNNTPGDGCGATCQSEIANLIVHKNVVNNGVGTLNAGNFQLTIDSVNATQDLAIPVTVNVSHAVSETNTFGYTKTYGGDCDADGNVTVGFNQTKTCNVINTMPYGTITVTKVVTNDDGGLLTVGSFVLKIDGVTVTSGNPKNVALGAHNVSETGVFGYSATFSGDCNSSGNVTVAAGESKSCTITNNDIAPSIELIKTVLGGNAAPDDFDVSIDGNIVTSGSSISVMANTAHVIDEEATVSGYSFISITGTSFKGVSCPSVLNGTITLLPGDVVTCTITNATPT